MDEDKNVGIFLLKLGKDTPCPAFYFRVWPKMTDYEVVSCTIGMAMPSWLANACLILQSFLVIVCDNCMFYQVHTKYTGIRVLAVTPVAWWAPKALITRFDPKANADKNRMLCTASIATTITRKQQCFIIYTINNVKRKGGAAEAP